MANKTQKEFDSLIKFRAKVNIPFRFIGKFIRKINKNVFSKRN